MDGDERNPDRTAAVNGLISDLRNRLAVVAISLELARTLATDDQTRGYVERALEAVWQASDVATRIAAVVNDVGA